MKTNIIPTPPRIPISGRQNPQMKNPMAKPFLPAIVTIAKVPDSSIVTGWGSQRIVKQGTVAKNPSQNSSVQQKPTQGSILPSIVATKAASREIPQEASREGSSDSKSSPETHFRNSRDVINAFDAMIHWEKR